MEVIVRFKLDYPFEGKTRVCMVRPRNICELIACMLRGWEYHTTYYSSDRFAIKYYN